MPRVWSIIKVLGKFNGVNFLRLSKICLYEFRGVRRYIPIFIILKSLGFKNSGSFCFNTSYQETPHDCSGEKRAARECGEDVI